MIGFEIVPAITFFLSTGLSITGRQTEIAGEDSIVLG